MPRYGSDIWSLFLKNGRRFPIATVYRLALQMIDVLEYIHGCTYVHADLKGANMLLGLGKEGEGKVFLVDFGLASHFTTSPEYKPDPKKMHNGTIEYTSRDAHNGVPTMRGDMEILAFNLVHWSGATLPWESVLSDPAKVQQLKDKHMQDITGFVKASYNRSPPGPIANYLKTVSELKFNEKPDYNKCRKYFTSALASLGATNMGPLKFIDVAGPSTTPLKRRVSARLRQESDDELESPEVVPKKARKPSKSTKANPAEKDQADEPEPKVTKSAKIHFETPSKKKSSKMYQFNIELDVSIDADVVVNVNRKSKKKKDTKKNLNESESDTSVVVETKRTKKQNGASETLSRREMLNIPKTAGKSRAGEYNGKSAK